MSESNKKVPSKTEKSLIKARDMLAKQQIASPPKKEGENDEIQQVREGGGPNSPPVKESQVPDFIAQAKAAEKVSSSSAATKHHSSSSELKPSSSKDKSSKDKKDKKEKLEKKDSSSSKIQMTNRLTAAREKEQQQQHQQQQVSEASPEPIPRQEVPVATPSKTHHGSSSNATDKKERKDKSRREEKEKERERLSPGVDGDDEDDDLMSAETRSHRSSRRDKSGKKEKKEKKEKKDKKEAARLNDQQEQEQEQEPEQQQNQCSASNNVTSPTSENEAGVVKRPDAFSPNNTAEENHQRVQEIVQTFNQMSSRENSVDNNFQRGVENGSFASKIPIVPNNSFAPGHYPQQQEQQQEGSSNNDNNIIQQQQSIENIFPPGSRDERKAKFLMAQLRSIQAELEMTLYESATSAAEEEEDSGSATGREESTSNNNQNQQQNNQNDQNAEIVGYYHPNFRRETSRMEKQVMDQIEMDLNQQLKAARSISGGGGGTNNSRSTTATTDDAMRMMNWRSQSQQQQQNVVEGSHRYYPNNSNNNNQKDSGDLVRSHSHHQHQKFDSAIHNSRTEDYNNYNYDTRFIVGGGNENNNNSSPSLVSSAVVKHENKTTQEIVDSWKTRPVGAERRKQILLGQTTHLKTVLADIDRSFEVDFYSGKTSLKKDPNEPSPLRDREVKQAVLLRSSHLLAAQRTLGTEVRSREDRHRQLLEAIRDLPATNAGAAGDSSSNIANLLRLHLAS